MNGALSTQNRQTFFLTVNRFFRSPPGRGLPSPVRGPDERNPPGLGDDGREAGALGAAGLGAEGVLSLVSAMCVCSS
jgi:hypothetical protein